MPLFLYLRLMVDDRCSIALDCRDGLPYLKIGIDTENLEPDRSDIGACLQHVRRIASLRAATYPGCMACCAVGGRSASHHCRVGYSRRVSEGLEIKKVHCTQGCLESPCAWLENR